MGDLADRLLGADWGVDWDAFARASRRFGVILMWVFTLLLAVRALGGLPILPGVLVWLPLLTLSALGLDWVLRRLSRPSDVGRGDPPDGRAGAVRRADWTGGTRGSGESLEVYLRGRPESGLYELGEPLFFVDGAGLFPLRPVRRASPPPESGAKGDGEILDRLEL